MSIRIKWDYSPCKERVAFRKRRIRDNAIRRLIKQEYWPVVRTASEKWPLHYHTISFPVNMMHRWAPPRWQWVQVRFEWSYSNTRCTAFVSYT